MFVPKNETLRDGLQRKKAGAVCGKSDENAAAGS
jgi:hypothetical protein